MKQSTPFIKGVITGVALIVMSLVLYYGKEPGNSPFQYLGYIIYAGGIAWTLIAFSRSASYQGKFGQLFNQGFRCFVVVTLVMVTFTGIFTKSHPELIQESSIAYREDLVKNEKDKLPAEIDKEVEDYKNQFITRLVSVSIFGYLIMGAIFTAAGAGLLLMRRN